MKRATFEEQLRRLLNDRQRKSAPVAPVRVLGRNKDGSEQHLRLDGTCPQRGSGNNDIGQVVVLPSAPDSTRRSLGLPTVRIIGGILAAIVRQDPVGLRRGELNVVAVYGRPSLLMAQLQYLVGGETPHPGVTVEFVNLLEEGRLSVHVRVDGSAPLARGLPVSYGTSGGLDALATPTVLPHRVERFYDILPPSGAARYLVLHRQEDGTVTVVRYTGTGVALGPSNPGMVLANTTELSAPWTVPIVSDAATHRVADDSLIWVDDVGTLNVTDFAAEITYSYSPAAGKVIGAWDVESRIWWLEWEPPGGTAAEVLIRLRRRFKDLDVEGDEILWERWLGNLQSGEFFWTGIEACAMSANKLCVVASYNDGVAFFESVCGVWGHNGDGHLLGAVENGLGVRGIGLSAAIFTEFGAARGNCVWKNGVGGEIDNGEWRNTELVPPGESGDLWHGASLVVSSAILLQPRSGEQPPKIYEGPPFGGEAFRITELQEEPEVGPVWTAFLIST